MGARAVPLTVARGLTGQSPLIQPVRFDLPDYGPPGNHFGGPWAKTKAFSPPGFSALGDAGPAGPEAPEICVPARGDSFCSSISVLTGVTTVLATAAITLPFVLMRGVGGHGGGNNSACDFQAKIATDNSVALGILESGVNVFGSASGVVLVDPNGNLAETFPSTYFTSPPYFIKFIFRNLSAGTVDYFQILDVTYLQ